MTLHAVLAVQGNLKGQGMAEGQCLALFNSPVLVRTLADLLANLGL